MDKINLHPASQENPGFLLWQVSTLWSRSTTAALKPLGLSHPQFVIHAAIDFLKGKSQEEIGVYVVLDPKPFSHLLRSLQVKGLIEVLDAPRLTSTGIEMLAKALPIIERADANFFASIDLKNSEMVRALQMLGRANFSKDYI